MCRDSIGFNWYIYKIQSGGLDMAFIIDLGLADIDPMIESCCSVGVLQSGTCGRAL